MQIDEKFKFNPDIDKLKYPSPELVKLRHDEMLMWRTKKEEEINAIYTKGK